ncbi:hypothetical protein ACO1ZG_16295 [Enterobacter kobei]|uniref:hypothetical protein n=1 Tax=Enterobacter kobei TaxID=208224 RepID=UPI003B8631F7
MKNTLTLVIALASFNVSASEIKPGVYTGCAAARTVFLGANYQEVVQEETTVRNAVIYDHGDTFDYAAFGFNGTSEKLTDIRDKEFSKLWLEPATEANISPIAAWRELYKGELKAVTYHVANMNERTGFMVICPSQNKDLK